MTAAGDEVDQAFDEGAVAELVKRYWRQVGPMRWPFCLMHAYANPAHEKQAARDVA